MNIKDILNRPIRYCKLPIESSADPKADKGVKCLVRLRKRCGITNKRVSDMDECPNRSYLI